ncbi:MAG TPA: DUF6456 domain-containing protein [Candidatus Binatia bacterium]|nr:DUF6456 domain-containing protein [Candidatus Binatia bacterium]
MSARSVTRALERLAAPRCVLAPDRAGGYGVFPNGNRRRRPAVRLTGADVRELVSAGALDPAGEDTYALSAAGRARVTREQSTPDEAYAAQHQPIVDRAVMEHDGDVRIARGYDADRLLRRLSLLSDGAGRPWLDGAELGAAARLKADWQRSEIGLVRGSDWSAPPKGSTARSGVLDDVLAARCDARRRLSDALAELAAPLRGVVERVLLREEGLEALERAEAWPTRSGKLALKLALAQLAANYGSRAVG